MIGQQDLDRVIGATAYDGSGEKIGKVDTVFVDDQTGEPTFALVNTGMFGTRSSFVPIRDASLSDDGLQIRHSKDRVKDAPNIDADERLEPSDEAELYRYYGLDYSQGYGDTMRDDTEGLTRSREPATGGMPSDINDQGTVGHDTSGPTTDDAMTRSEEELRIGTQRREVGRARLRKHVVTEHVTKTVPVQREEVHIEREPITQDNIDRATEGPAISEEEHEVVLHEEQPVVDKQAVPKERVRLDKDVHTDEEQVEADVRKEEIDVAGLEESRESRT